MTLSEEMEGRSVISEPQTLDIYSYLDYRAYCRDFYHYKKRTDSDFSYRSFARTAGIAGSYLKHVIDGIRNLSPEMSTRFGAGMGLHAHEIEYFETLVRFNQATGLDEQAIYLDRLRRKRARALKPLGLTEAVDLLSHWYVVAIKELVVQANTIDPKTLQKVLRKRLPESLIEKTISKLVDLGWIFEKEGQWQSRASQIQFPDEVRSYVVRAFHRQMLELAIEALEDDLAYREFGAAIFTFPKKDIPKLKAKIKDMQVELVSFVQDLSNQATTDEQVVYYAGLQSFSLQSVERGPSHEN